MEKYTRRLDSLGLLLEIVGWLWGHCSVLLLSLCRRVEYSSLYVSERVSDDPTAKESMRCFVIVKAHPFRFFMERDPTQTAAKPLVLAHAQSSQALGFTVSKVMLF